MSFALSTVIVGFFLLPLSSFAQGPPINTDTPILLGLEGKAVAFRSVVIRKSQLYQEGNKIADPLEREVTATILPVVLPYNLTTDLQLGALVPLMNVQANSSLGTNRSFGLSDISLFAKHLIIQVDRLQETFRVLLKASVKLPTGSKNAAPALGTGTVDYSFGTVGAWIGKHFGVYGDVSYALNGTSDGYKFGNGLTYNIAFAFRAIPTVYETYPTEQWNVYLELNGKYTSKDELNGPALQNTGGNVLFLSPGLQYIPSRYFLLEASMQIPISQSLNGTQLGNDIGGVVGARILFF